MKKYFMLFVLSLAVFNLGFSQSEQEIKAQITTDAGTSGNAALEWNVDQILKYTHPDVAKFAGGMEKLKGMLDATKDQMDTSGISIDAFEVLEVKEFVKEQGEYRCLVATQMKMSVPGSKMTNQSHLFGFYNEEVKHWTFVEANQMKGPLQVQIFPDFKTEITIPDDVMTPE